MTRPRRERVRVQISFPPPKSVYNPYTILSCDSLRARPDVDLRTFSWRSALLGAYDVFHVHWPEILVSGRTPTRQFVRQALFLLLLAKLGITRTPIVRTLHNLDLPAGISRTEVALLRLAERRTALWIVLNRHSPVPTNAPSVLIPHPHFRDWFAQYDDRPQPQPGAIAFFGRIRRYKGVEQLLDAFSAIDMGATGPVSLHISGYPSTTDLADALTARVDGDHRVRFDFGFADDAALVAQVSAAELVVLPYPKMHNSGAVFTALSLDRPILIPDNEVNRDLAREVGPGWVHLFTGDLQATDIVRALQDARATDRGERPDLGARSWEASAAAHVTAYRRACGEHLR